MAGRSKYKTEETKGFWAPELNGFQKLAQKDLDDRLEAAKKEFYDITMLFFK